MSTKLLTLGQDNQSIFGPSSLSFLVGKNQKMSESRLDSSFVWMCKIPPGID